MTEPVPALLPSRIVNEHVYCPRLAYLEWVDRRFTDNADTLEGRIVHRRVDLPRGTPPEPDADAGDDPPSSRSVTLSSERLGLTAKLDLIESRGAAVVPVEYKRGRPRSADEPLWEPELAQVAVHVALLRDAGYTVDHAEVYFHATRSRHRVDVDDMTIAWALEAAADARAAAAQSEAPPPLVDSPKCPRCSLVGICLPDEVNALRGAIQRPRRRLMAADPAAQPLYASVQGTRVTKRGGRVVLLEDGAETASRRLIDVSHIAIFGRVEVGNALLHACFQKGVPVLWLTWGGWLRGVATGGPTGHVELRVRQYRAAATGVPGLPGGFVAGKIRNARTLLRRHGGPAVSAVLDQLAALARQAAAETEVRSLLGIEGTAARLYYQHFPALVRPALLREAFSFEGRNRRPPRDRLNALISFASSLLVKDTTIAVIAAGLDPHLGLFHSARFGRPSLALDLAEEFRPLIADSVVLTAINNGEVRPDDFVFRAGAVALTDRGRRALIGAYERRMTTELVHPVFGYKASYRRALEIQARLLAALLLGDTPEYRPLTTR
jgi:CRISP-associated protein Cas1